MGYALTASSSQSDAPGGVPSASPTALTGSYVNAAYIQVTGYRELDLQATITNLGTGPVTRLDVQFEYTLDSDPAAAKWSPYQVEAVDSATGISVPVPYTIQQSLAGYAVTFALTWTVQVRGSYMRAKVKAGAGVSTNSALTLKYLRRS